MATEKIPDFNQYIKNLKLKQTNNQRPLILGQVKPIGDMRDPKVRSEINKKISEGAKNLTPNNAKNIPLKEAAQKCTNFCRSEGVFILPLRYTVIRANAPALPATLGSNVKDVAISHFKYGVEMIDTGYIYRLLKRKSGKTEWAGYKVTAKGFLSYFVVGKPAPVTVSEFACKSAGHNFNASMIVIEDNPSDKAQTAYIIHTHVPLSPNKIKEYEKNAEAYAKDGKWQKFDVTSWAGGNTTQTHCFNGSQLNSIYNYMKSFESGRVAAFNKNFKETPKKYAAMALYDPIGITVKLNNHRNEAYASIDSFLETVENGVSNQRKLDIAQKIDTLKGMLAKSTQQFHTTRELETRIPLDGRLQGRLLTIDDMSKAAQKRGDTAEVQRLIKRRQDVLKEHDELMKRREKNKQQVIDTETQANWQVCDENLSYQEVSNFQKLASSQYNNALNVANRHAQDHLNWLNSEHLLDALDVYDETDLQSGCAFKAHVASMLFGMEGATEAAKKIDKWIKDPKYIRSNLFIRGLYSNQNSAKKIHEDVIAKATDYTAVGIKAAKSVVDFLKKTDSAWDEWVRNQSKNNTWNVFFSSSEKKVMLYVSNFARVVFRAGMGTQAERVFVKGISQKLLFAQMGELAEKLRFDQLVYNVNPEKQTVGKPSGINPELAQRVALNTKSATLNSLDVLINDAMVKKGEVAKTLEQIIGKDMKNATNNYHQVRASGILILLESINLATMINSGKYQTKEQLAALSASVAALFAFGLDIFYGLAKGVREAATQTTYGGAGAAATRGAANIQRAGIRWVSGSLSAFAGSISAWLDYQKVNEYKDKIGIPISVIALYATRSISGLIATFFGVFAALTYIGPLMDYLKRVGGSPAIRRLGGYVFGEGALLIFKNTTREVVRNFLLRGIAWASGVGLILTIVEVSLLIYMDATKLRRWCEHSTFRKDKTKTLMPEKQEVEDYAKLFA